MIPTDVRLAVPVEPLTAWLRAEGLLPADATADDVDVVQLSGGSSNLTFRVRGRTGGGVDWVLRRPPVKGSLPTAHDVVREYRIQSALAPTGVPVAPMVAACADPEVIGAPFYLMGHLDGVVHADQRKLAALAPDEARQIALALVDALAAIHAVLPEETELRELARPEPFLDRTLRRWRRQWGLSRSPERPVPALDELFEVLERRRPPAAPVRLVHGDFNLGNVMYGAAEQTRVIAVLDWELATLGDALADLGSLLAYWGDAGRVMWQGRGGHLADANPGFPSSAELVERYAATSAALADARGGEAAAGEDALRLVPYYEVLATVKLAVIAAGAIRRMPPGDTAGPERVWGTVGRLADVARALAADSGLDGPVRTGP